MKSIGSTLVTLIQMTYDRCHITRAVKCVDLGGAAPRVLLGSSFLSRTNANPTRRKDINSYAASEKKSDLCTGSPSLILGEFAIEYSLTGEKALGNRPPDPHNQAFRKTECITSQEGFSFVCQISFVNTSENS